MNHPLRMVLVVSSLSAGGAERVISIMANYWAQKGWDVHLVTLGDGDSDFFALDGRVKRIALGEVNQSTKIFDAVRNNFRRIMKLRAAVRSAAPDAVISFLDRTNVLVLLATRGLGVPVVVSERTDPRLHDIGEAWKWLRRLVYPFAEALVVQTKEVKDWAISKILGGRSFVIPNPVVVELPAITNEEVTPVATPYLLAVGRMTAEKGFDLLLRAVASVFPDFPEWSLIILGEGPERRALEGLAKELGLDGRVHFPGRHANPVVVMRQAELFVLSSRYEGFPNALCESMACGLPVVSFDCPSGPREIIRQGVDGVLVPPEDIDKLAAALRELMKHPERRKELGARAVEITKRFGLENVMGMWEQLLLDLRRPEVQ